MFAEEGLDEGLHDLGLGGAGLAGAARAKADEIAEAIQQDAEAWIEQDAEVLLVAFRAHSILSALSMFS